MSYRSLTFINRPCFIKGLRTLDALAQLRVEARSSLRAERFYEVAGIIHDGELWERRQGCELIDIPERGLQNRASR